MSENRVPEILFVEDEYSVALRESPDQGSARADRFEVNVPVGKPTLGLHFFD